MDIMELFRNHLLTNALLAWLAAQLIKTVIYLIINRRLDLGRLVGDGGMPSGHSATVCALAATAAVEYGLGSPAFAISVILAVVVMHDAMGVRRQAGEHAKAINELMEMLAGDTAPEEKLQELLGHTPLQVILGGVLGVAVGIILG